VDDVSHLSAIWPLPIHLFGNIDTSESDFKIIAKVDAKTEEKIEERRMF